MEFPKLGCHCSEPSCKKLDFLPIKCDGCSNLYCNDHFKYSAHFCSNAFKNNVQVPECPLCGMPVPIPRNQQPDVAVGAHIDRDCRWDPSKERKVFTNKCTLKGCKTKEIIPVLCPECDNNFCLRHRHTADHNCIGSKATIRAKMYNAAADRNLSTKNAKPSINTKGIQDQNMSEDEALARAIALSLGDDNTQNSFSGSQRPRSTSPNTSDKSKCYLS